MKRASHKHSNSRVWFGPLKKTDFESYDPKPSFAALHPQWLAKSIKLLRLL